jgi:hypothetical protein
VSRLACAARGPSSPSGEGGPCCFTRRALADAHLPTPAWRLRCRTRLELDSDVDSDVDSASTSVSRPEVTAARPLPRVGTGRGRASVPPGVNPCVRERTVQQPAVRCGTEVTIPVRCARCATRNVQLRPAGWSLRPAVAPVPAPVQPSGRDGAEHRPAPRGRSLRGDEGSLVERSRDLGKDAAEDAAEDAAKDAKHSRGQAPEKSSGLGDLSSPGEGRRTVPPRDPVLSGRGEIPFRRPR